MQFVHDGRELSLLSLCKNSENFLKSFFVKVWKSNRTIWLAKNFLAHNSGTRILLDMQFVRDGRESSPLSSCKNSENSLKSFLKFLIVKVWKSNRVIWLAKRFLGHNLKNRIFQDMWFAYNDRESSLLTSHHAKNQESPWSHFLSKSKKVLFSAVFGRFPLLLAKSDFFPKKELCHSTVLIKPHNFIQNQKNP